MPDTVIAVENLSKRYIVGHQGPSERYHALRDTLVRHGRDLARKIMDMARGRPIIQGDEMEEFWALKDVSFEVKHGEVLGIVGRNGAGKSTLLKILSRITEPTAGRVVIDGRVASLLEVGTGFHPELTGRENIFLNGAILGMTRAEIRKKFDAIVEFAEVQRFLDTPVKRYSSGMYVRLAFAVAAHLEPEILVVDEVLAVGDAEFQKKCLGKMQDVAKTGRTVLFVSHNLSAVKMLCTRGVLIHQGTVLAQGSVESTLARYMGLGATPTSGIARPEKLSASVHLNRLEANPPAVTRGETIRFVAEIFAETSEIISDIALLIYAGTGERVAVIDLRSPKGAYRIEPEQRLILEAESFSLPLVEADYQIGLWLNSTTVSQVFMNLLTITVQPSERSDGLVSREPQHRGFVELQTAVRVV